MGLTLAGSTCRAALAGEKKPDPIALAHRTATDFSIWEFPLWTAIVRRARRSFITLPRKGNVGFWRKAVALHQAKLPCATPRHLGLGILKVSSIAGYHG